MPALNFKPQFAPMILLGLKPHTIRGHRKFPIKRNDTLYLYTGMRQKTCRRLLVCPCLAVTPIEILSSHRRVTLDGGARLYPAGLLSTDWVHLFAVRDGFKDADDFFAFFQQPAGGPFFGHLIEWEIPSVSSAPSAVK